MAYVAGISATPASSAGRRIAQGAGPKSATAT